MKNGYNNKWLLPAAIAALILVGMLGVRSAGVRRDPANEAATIIRPAALRADMQFLADDALEGRGTGTRGHEIAAKFMASEFEGMGLEPAGENGTYFQNVQLRSIRPDEKRTTLSLMRAGKEQALLFSKDFISYGDPGRTDISVEAPVVYVGFGATAPERGYDDYAGVDAKGKIVAYVYGAPAGFESTVRAHYSDGQVKAANAAAHGAVGRIVLDSPELEQLYSFKDRVRELAVPDMRWLDAEGRPNNYFPELRGAFYLNMEATARILEGSGKSPEEVYAAAKDGKPSSFPLSVNVKSRILSTLQQFRSPNVVARLRGSDPILRDEYVVYTAHLDHLGIGEPVNGDRIYNGALDNASGSACLLEIARAYSRMNPRPRRSILFVSVTGEEEGLLGSDYFAHNPTVEKRSLVADINVDGNLGLLWPMEDVTALGSEHSTLGAAAGEAARRMKAELSPDTHPEQVLFIRSDQYSFVKQGIPAVFLGLGIKSRNAAIKPGEILAKWLATVYHTPQDDMSQKFDFESGAKFARWGFLLGYVIAQQNERPAWNRGDFFGERYGNKN